MNENKAEKKNNIKKIFQNTRHRKAWVKTKDPQYK